MAATVKGTSGLAFGTPTNAGVIMQSLDETRSTQTAEATDEDGDVVGFCIYGGTKQEVSGEYLYIGADLGTLGATVTLSGLTSPGGLYLTELGTKSSNTGFKMGSFKAISVTGVS